MTLTAMRVNEAVLLGSGEGVRARLAESVEFLGASLRHATPGSLRQAANRAAALVTDAETLAQLAKDSASGVSAVIDLVQAAESVFVYGFEPKESHAAVIQALSRGALQGIEEIGPADDTFTVSGNRRDLTRQLTGVSVATANATRDFRFVEAEAVEGIEPLVHLGSHPYFVRIEYGRTEVFLVACKDVVDLEEAAIDGAGLLPWFSRVAPLAIFLRRALGESVWRSPGSRACVIIDDPLLKPRYGFLEYRRLSEAVESHRFAASIAFIPWNHQRSHRQVVDLFSRASGRLSLCVHGCDHTNSEFATGGFELLRGKAHLALQRMRAHAERFGVPFSEVMVFPQGRFSPDALRALDACGYLAAVNTHVHPSDGGPGPKIRDVLDVAVTTVGGFPLFERRYPKDPAEFALDLFLGKPALVVEHHGYFRHGYAELTQFAGRLTELDESLEWGDLDTICSRACLQRTRPDATVEVRFYSNRFQLTNHTAETKNYVLFRKWTSAGALPSVTIDGHAWEREQHRDNLALRLSLKAGATAKIRIWPAAGKSPDGAWKPARMYNAGVFARRMAREVVDNYVQPNRLLAGLASGAQMALRGKGNASR